MASTVVSTGWKRSEWKRKLYRKEDQHSRQKNF